MCAVTARILIVVIRFKYKSIHIHKFKQMLHYVKLEAAVINPYMFTDE